VHSLNHSSPGRPAVNTFHALVAARRRARHLGIWAGIATIFTEISPSITGRIEHIVGRPSLFELQQAGPMSRSSREALRLCVGLDDEDWDRIEAEFADVERDIAFLASRCKRRYPDSFAVERETSLLLYGVTRLTMPAFIIETGVADGLSTSVLMAALRRNGRGVLHSFDIADDVGSLVGDRTGWHLHICEPALVEGALRKLVAELPAVNLFVHDADHRFLPQLWEYEVFAGNAPAGSFLISDDVDLSYAFHVFCRRRGLRPSYLFDTRKVAGIVRL
jgi:hypothetical protein